MLFIAPFKIVLIIFNDYVHSLLEYFIIIFKERKRKDERDMYETHN